MNGISRRSLLAGAGALPLIAGLPQLASAQLRVDITKGNVDPTPIAISPFAGNTAEARELGQRLADLVSADLDGSGLFRTIDRDAYIQSSEEMRSGPPRFADWRQINAQALVTGIVNAPTGGTFDTEFRLWDIFAGQQMSAVRFTASPNNWRRIGHKIADNVYQRMTGESGYFDTRIVYVSETGPVTSRVKRIAVMDSDGANNRFLTDGSRLVLTPQISPDGERVAYMEFRGRLPQIYQRDIDGGRDTLLADFPGMSFSPRFAPNGKSMLITVAQNGNSDLFRFDLASRKQTRLTNDAGIDTSPSYSPDASEIVFNSDRGGTPHLYIMSANGGNARRISFGDGRYGSPAWSPRGDLIAFVNIKSGMFHIGIMRPDGSDERLITRSYLDESPSWAPNGRLILYSRQDTRSGQTRLRTIDTTGNFERELPTPSDATDPDWSPLIP